ncbi:hypothetical protein BDF22DRAFT_272082 [Syncephalis plumigaleata]|nr:hypothetical protein BDF22DRAFT_272082 [Syncephalis plumigaleata]
MQRRLEQQPLESSTSMPRASPSPIASLPTSPMKVRSPSEPRGSIDQQLSETVNLEYLRHIVLKFVEFRAQRQQLIPVLGMLLKLTPQELSKIERYKQRIYNLTQRLLYSN